MASLDSLLQFAEDTKDINPNLKSDIEKGFIKPCKMLDEVMLKYYNKNKRN